jgi:hypothetical protein
MFHIKLCKPTLKGDEDIFRENILVSFSGLELGELAQQNVEQVAVRTLLVGSAAHIVQFVLIVFRRAVERITDQAFQALGKHDGGVMGMNVVFNFSHFGCLVAGLLLRR